MRCVIPILLLAVATATLASASNKIDEEKQLNKLSEKRAMTYSGDWGKRGAMTYSGDWGKRAMTYSGDWGKKRGVTFNDGWGVKRRMTHDKKKRPMTFSEGWGNNKRSPLLMLNTESDERTFSDKCEMQHLTDMKRLQQEMLNAYNKYSGCKTKQ